MTTSQLEVPGGRLHVIDEGSGPPIVLLHAGIADTRSWDEMAPLLGLVWPDVAHMIGMEQPARLTEAIVGFLAPLERW